MYPRKPSLLKKIFILLGILILCISLYSMNQSAGTKRSGMKVKIAKVTKGSLEQIVQAHGSLEPSDRVKVRSEVDGNIIAMRVKEGDLVKKGDVLIEVDPTRLKAEVMNAEVKLKRLEGSLKNLVEISGPFDELQSQNNLKKSKIALEYTQKEYSSMQRMYKEEIINRRQLEDAERSLENAKLEYSTEQEQIKFQREKQAKDVREQQGDIQLAKEDLAEARRKLDKTKITAPLSGTIVEDNLKEKRSVGTGEEIFSVGDLSKYIARIKVDELDIGKVKVGQPVKLSSDAFKETKLPGKVISIASQATRQTFAEIEVVVEIESTMNQPVRPNLSVDGDVMINQMQNVLKVPVESVLKQDNKSYVFLVDKERARKREVTTSLSNADSMIIDKGLKEGDLVVTQGINALKDNDRIQYSKPLTDKSKDKPIKKNQPPPVKK